MKRHPLIWLTTALAGLMMLAGMMGQTTAQESTPEAEVHPAAPAVEREVLSRGFPDAGDGDALEVVRYTIPPDLTLPAHTHPGMQVAWVESGVLHYSVLEGAVPVYRGGDLENVEEITPETGEVALYPGDGVVEPEGVVHFGRNGGPDPVVLLVASLFDPDQPSALIAATPVASPAP